MSDLQVNDLVRLKSVRGGMSLRVGDVVRLVRKSAIYGASGEANWQVQGLTKSKPEHLYLKESRLEKI